ncbi:IS3 family transposase [Paraburkholderia sp. CNPSo 3157]|uniref:IS3 family transposase n=1 Tax=Paraburkholderia franconis TaxID=2654983 RepID=A0A7X1NJ90_9BURK|nr:IS3 family transposase [Paraburkholderia franconis]
MLRSFRNWLPTYGYRRAWALLRRRRDAVGRPRVNAKRVYRVMRAHNLRLAHRPRHTPSSRRHDGKVAVGSSNARLVLECQPKPLAKGGVHIHYNESHPHSALKYCSPREFRQRATSPTEA